jgi:hypothetical protein
MKIKIVLLLSTFSALVSVGFSDTSIMSENARDYRDTIDEIIVDFIKRGSPPSLDKALHLQAYENNMLSLARLDPVSARNMPTLLLANEVRLKDLRNLPGELIVARARQVGVQVLEPNVRGIQFRYSSGLLFKREKSFESPGVSGNYPRDGDWCAHNGYALHALRSGQYEEAARHFEMASIIPKSKSGTIRKVWEYENLISAAWAHLLNGSIGDSRRLLVQANQLAVQAPPSQRGRYLESVLNQRAHPSLDMALKNTLALR